MADQFTVLEAPIGEDLLPLTALLRSRGLPHQIYEEGGRQVLAVRSPEHVEPVKALYRAWRSGEVQIEARPGTTPVARTGGPRWQEAPVTIGFALVSIAVFMFFQLGGSSVWMSYLTFLPFEVSGNQLQFGDMGSQYWRLVTPIFLHFGWLHIAFNCLWLWELGRRCEAVLGSGNTLGLILVIAVISNACQYLYGGYGLFGGLSGVVYGLLGFTWVAPLLQPRWRIQPMSGIMLFMVGWLLLGVFGVIEAVGLGAIANAAHIAGLVSGGVLGVAFGALSRMQGST